MLIVINISKEFLNFANVLRIKFLKKISHIQCVIFMPNPRLFPTLAFKITEYLLHFWLPWLCTFLVLIFFPPPLLHILVNLVSLTGLSSFHFLINYGYLLGILFLFSFKELVTQSHGLNCCLCANDYFWRKGLELSSSWKLSAFDDG